MGKKQLMAILLAGYLGLYHGYAALWDSNSDVPSHIFPYREETYSHTDKAALQKGIPFFTQQERTALLEDYFS